MRTRLHLLPDTERALAQVSSRSLWHDDKWWFDNIKIGLPDRDSMFDWSLRMDGDSTLLSPQWSPLLEDCRKLVWSLLTDARSGKGFDPVTLSGGFRQQLSKLLRWMAVSGYESFSQLDTEASWEFHDHLLGLLRTKKSGDVASGSFQFALQILSTIYRQSAALSEANVAPMPESPYDGGSICKVAKTAATIENGWIEPLPDCVALRVLGQCMRWMGTPLDDVIRLRDLYLSLEVSKDVGVRAVETALSEFRFSVIPGESEPWRDRLGTEADYSRSTGEVRTRLDAAVRALVGHASSACVTQIQGTTGIRISEVAALRSGIDEATGLPSCVSIQKSKTGLNELFFLNSQVTKIHEGSMMNWVLGMRPVGSSYLPPAVTALLGLERLFEPWRTGSDLPWLLVTPGGRLSLSRQLDMTSPATRRQIAKQMKNFVGTYGGLADLPDILRTASGSIDITPYKSGEGMRTHQWRKTFALYILRTDPNMLPAISQHFKHISLAMTEEGYIGNDPELLDSIESVRRQRTVKFLLEQANSSTVIAGGMADLVREHRAQLRAVIGNSDDGTAFQKMEAWVTEGDLRIWFADHGKCFMSLTPGESRCHTMGQTNPWIKGEPNYAQRNPTVCSGCKCFAVDHEHLDFWQARYQKNASILKAAGKDHFKEFTVARERMRQSASILHTLGVPVADAGAPIKW
ncbi:hypothetical protein [Dechloromonas sp. A34]|uniref:hypothetical protein n=1 Tax=Dechloromonas sp. A34 TaxID=447588 RepID=UPI0022490E8B|nr:hypothetical protein [Dechloromonas sp. A34]